MPSLIAIPMLRTCSIVLYSTILFRPRMATPHSGYKLQPDRFYPDVVAETRDGRLLVVEYKGKDYATNDDSKEKKLLGEVWAKGSNGRALFLMAVKKDERGSNVHEQIRGTIEGW